MKRSLTLLLLIFGFLSIISFAEEKRFASWYLIDGQKKYEKGLYISAIIDLKSAVHMNSNLILAYRYLGLSYSKMYLWEQAAREYNKLLFFNPSASERRQVLETVYEWENKKEFLTAPAKYTYYVLQYREKVWEEPYNFLNYLGLAEVYECKKEYDKTAGFYRYLSEQNPDKLIFRLYLAEDLTYWGKIDEALTIYRAAVQEEPFNVEVIVGLNFALKKKYEEELRNDPESIAARIGLARALSGLKRHEKAIDVYRSVLKKDYVNAEARIELAQAYEEVGKYEDAINEYKLLDRLDPKAAIYLFRAAILYEKLGSIEDARATYMRVIAANPENQDAKDALDSIRIKYGFELGAVSDDLLGRAGKIDYSKEGFNFNFYAPFNLTTRAIYGYSNYDLTLAGPVNAKVVSYVVGIERILPLNYRVYGKYIGTRYDSLHRTNNDYELGVQRSFIDGGYFEASIYRRDIYDNINTLNNNTVADCINLKTQGPVFERLEAGCDATYINYIDNNSGIDALAFCKYELFHHPASLSVVADIRYDNTAVTVGKDYWTPRDYFEPRVGFAWKYSFDERNYYLVDYRVGRDSDSVESNDMKFEVNHELESWLKLKVTGDLYNSTVLRTNCYTYYLSIIL